MGQLCTIKSGKSDTQDAIEGGPYAFFDRSRTVKRSSRYLYDCEALIVPGEGTEFLPRHFSGKFDLHQRAYALYDFSERVDVRFLFYYLHFQSDYFPRVAVGATVKSLRRRHFEQLPVSLPDLPEQLRIVSLVEPALAAMAAVRANIEQNLRSATNLFLTQLNVVFGDKGDGWESRPFDDCIEAVKYTTKIQRKRFLPEGSYPIVSQEAQFTNGYWNNAVDVFRVTRPIVVFGDHTMVLKYVDFDFVLGADGVKVLLPRPFLNPKFFFYALRSARLKSLGYSRHYRLLRELDVWFPSLDEQLRIAEKLDALDAATEHLASAYEGKLAALGMLSKSLLHEAFTGAL